MKVFIKRVCGCVNKIDLKETTEFETKEEAEAFVESSLKKLDLTSCHTHRFFVESSSDEQIVISSELDDDAFSLKM